jgi:hypothetical protein
LVSSDGLVLFTDGSSCGDKASAGVFSDILNVRASYALGSEYCISEETANRAISIFSDSRTALLARKSYAVSSIVELKCRNSLQELALSNRVRLVWVPEQCGIHGNEEADSLARARSSSAFVELEPCLPLATSSIKRR